MAEEKTFVEDVDRSRYDFRNDDGDSYKVDEGLTPAIVEQISREKNDPDWMRDFRLKSLDIFNRTDMPDWGPSIEGLNMENIVTYVRPHTKMSATWDEVPAEIKDTFERLGIPQAERESLAGVGAQYDSELVYHNVKAEVAAQGVIYTDLESALHGPKADMIREHFMHLVPPTDHKFAALHGAVWSGGSFVYVPPGVSVEIPLQSYFRLNSPARANLSIRSSSSTRTPTCTLSRDVPPRSTMWPTSTPAVWSSTWARTPPCVTRPLKTGRRTCTTSTPSVPVWKRAARWNGFPAPSAPTSATSTP